MQLTVINTSCFGKVENITGKGELARNHPSLTLKQHFGKRVLQIIVDKGENFYYQQCFVFKTMVSNISKVSNHFGFTKYAIC